MRLTACVLALWQLSAVVGQLDDLDDVDLNGIADDVMKLSETENANITRRLNQNEASTGLSTLRYVCVITRHGSRSPTSTYPTDPFPFTNPKFWPDGPGQLTRYGKQQLFRTGRILRRRYNGFLNANYFPNDTSVRSNPYDRDYMSAAALLAGLYPPVGFQIWNRRIYWQPIPIYEDRFDVAEIGSKPNICPRFAQAQKKALDDLNSSANSKYDDLLKYLSDNMGQKVNQVTQIAGLWDTLVLQQENGFKIPAWAKKVFPSKMAKLEGIAFRALLSATDEQVRLVAGPMLQMISDQLNTKARGEMKPDLKLYILAAHDATLRALLDGLDIHKTFPIDTSAFMVFELHENSAGHNVKVLYFRNSATPKPKVLNMPLCNNPCSLDSFNVAIEKYIPENWKEECMNVTVDDNST